MLQIQKLPPALVISFLLICSSCSSVKIPVLAAETPIEHEYQELGEVKAACPSIRCPEPTEEACTDRLARGAARMGADALIVREVIFTESGSFHGGLEISEVECSGTGIKFLST